MTKENVLELVSAKQLAKMLALSVRTVWRYRAAQRLPKPLTVGSSIRWRVSDIRMYLECDCNMNEFELMKGNKK